MLLVMTLLKLIVILLILVLNSDQSHWLLLWKSISFAVLYHKVMFNNKL